MESGQTLNGKWGGRWEFIRSRDINDSRIKRLILVRSIRTGYVTEMREDSFKLPPDGDPDWANVMSGEFVMKTLRCPNCGHDRNELICRCPIADRRCARCHVWWRLVDGESLVGSGHVREDSFNG